jgi:hypothetical protein
VLDRMVLGTAWIILRCLHKVMGRKGGEEKTDKDKMRDKLEYITREYSQFSDGHLQSEHCEVSKIQDELLSVRAVLEMRIEEVRGMKKELERRRWWSEERGTQTFGYEEEHGSPADKTCRCGFILRISFFSNILTIYRELMTVCEQKECRESKSKKEDELKRENSDTEIDTIVDVNDKDNETRNKVNPWRNSGYITSDSEDFIMKQLDCKTEIVDKNQDRIASIF